MKTNLLFSKAKIFAMFMLISCAAVSCDKGDGNGDDIIEPEASIVKDDFSVDHEEGDMFTEVYKQIRINIDNLTDKNLSYEWTWDGEAISYAEDLAYVPTQEGDHALAVAITDFESTVAFEYNVTVAGGLEISCLTGSMNASVDKPYALALGADADSYQWYLDGEKFSQEAQFNNIFTEAGQHTIKIETDTKGGIQEQEFTINVIEPSAYISSVFDYLPAPGQFVNTLPVALASDTQSDMNMKVLASLENNKKSMITLGGYGGYVVVGFNQTIENKDGLCDFRVLGNAFYSAANPDEENLPGGSCEPSIIMVSKDVNKNGIPDDEWYEIQGSSHIDHTKECWYNKAKEAGNDVEFYFRDFELTYTKPEKEPSADGYATYIPWKDNKGNEGYLAKNTFHGQPYYPSWVKEDKLTFKGSRLPQNAIDESGKGNYFVLYALLYGYGDNGLDAKDDSAIDISWAVDDQKQPANLDGVDFIKMYGGVNQVNGWLGECSTEVTGVTNLHMVGETVSSNQDIFNVNK